MERDENGDVVKMTEDEARAMWRQREIDAIRAVNRMGGRNLIVRLIMDEICQLHNPPLHGDRRDGIDHRVDYDPCTAEHLARMCCGELIYEFRKKFGAVSVNEDDFGEHGNCCYPEIDFDEYWAWRFENEEKYLQKEIQAYDAVEAMGGRSTVITELNSGHHAHDENLRLIQIAKEKNGGCVVDDSVARR